MTEPDPAATVSPATVAAELKGIRFPTNRTELVHHARRNDSGRDPEPVVALLERIADRQYDDLDDVQLEVEKAR